MTRLLPSLAHDDRGTSVIEMALIMPVFATLLIGVIDISRAYSQKLLLEQAAQRAVEKVQQYQSNSSTYVTLKAEAALAAQESGFTSVLPTDVVVDYWLECNGTRQSVYETNCSAGQSYARWVTVEITAKFTPMFSSSRWPGSNSDGTYTIDGKAGLRTQ